MSAVPIRTFTATLSRSTSPIAWEAFAGAPLSIVGALPAGQDFAGVTAVRAELHDSLTNSEAPLAVSDALTALPTGSSVTLTFSSAATNRPAGRYWVSVYATYADARLEVFRLAELHLVEGAVSQLTPQAPAPALYATSAEITAVLDRVVVLEATPPGSSLVTSVAGRQGAITLTWSDIGGTALPLALTSAPGLTSAAGGAFGTAAFVAASSLVPATRTINGQALSANVTITAAMIGLDLVTNTADASKPVSTAQQTALNLKANLASPTFAGTVTAPAFSGPLTGPVTGNASTATALATARTITLTGSVTGSVTFDGSANATVATALDLSSPGPIGATTASTVRASNFTSTTGVNSFGNTNFQDLSVFNLLGSSKANLQSALTLGAFDDATHKGIILTGVLTITSSGSTPVFTYASGAAAIHRTALGLGTLATLSPTGTADATTYLRGDNTWATITSSGGFIGTPNRIIIGGATTNADSNFEATLVTAAPNATNNVARLAATGTATNIPVNIAPKGTGAFILGPAPDNGVNGGNARGPGSVDLQITRSLAAQVASGTNTFAVGINNTVSGSVGAAFGDGNTSSGSSFLFGSGNVGSSNSIGIGSNNTVSGSETSLALGRGNTVTGLYTSAAIGRFNTCSSSGAIAIGQGNLVSGTLAMAFGQNTKADRGYMATWASSRFENVGDCQEIKIHLKGKTTGVTSVDLVTPDNSIGFVLVSGKAFACTVEVFGLKSDGSDGAYFIRKGIVKDVGVTPGFIGTFTTLGTDYPGLAGTPPTVTIALSDGTTDYIKVSVTGVASETWRWNCIIKGLEMEYGL